MVWFIQLLELSVPQYLELMLNNRDVNFLSISLDIALSPPQQVVVVACGLTLLHATPLEFCHLLTTTLALCQPYSEVYFAVSSTYHGRVIPYGSAGDSRLKMRVCSLTTLHITQCDQCMRLRNMHVVVGSQVMPQEP